MKAQFVSVLLVLLLVAGCAEFSDITQPVPNEPSFSLAVATNANHPGFHWLPPISQSGGHAEGDFDPDLEPTVLVCRLVDGACGSTVATFSPAQGHGSERVRVDATGEHYIVNWHTGRYGARAGDQFRVAVLVNEVVLGSADVSIAGNGAGSERRPGGENVEVRAGTTLPVAFSIERGIPLSVVVEPAEIALEPGGTQQLVATVAGLNGNVLPLPVSWSSSNSAVAVVNSDGLVTAAGEGNATITAAAAAGVSGSASVTVASAGPGMMVGSGVMHTCAVDEESRALCWGAGGFGRLGNGSELGSPSPVVVSGGLEFSSASAGNMHSCGLTTSGQAYCWGAGARLGNGTMDGSSVPGAVSGGHLFASISTGFNATCGVTSAGAGHCWGIGFNGELGDGLMSFSLAPTAVAGGLTFGSISVGSTHSCGVTTGGAAYCWGSNGFGKLGTGDFTSSATPVAVAGEFVFTSISTGEAHTCGLDTNGQALCWGAGGSGQLGNGVIIATNPNAVPVAGGLTFTTVSVGGAHTCGVTNAGEGYCWGNGGGGRLGNGSGTNSSIPVAVAGGLMFTRISAGASHSCGVTTGSQVYCWGTGTSGQLGNGSLTSQLVPVEVSQFP